VAKRTRVVVYGVSLNLAGIAASLKAEAGLEVVSVDPRRPTARECLSQFNPAVVAFDLGDPDAGLDIAILRERPGLLLIGVDPSSDELLVLSSRPHQALSVADLVEVMQRESGREKLEGDS
jgi:hypothetical protein